MVRKFFHFIVPAALGALACLALGPAGAHPGGLAKDGAHMSRDTGERHWHLEIPCQGKPCNVGMLPHSFLDYLDPPPDECPGLANRIVDEAQRTGWGRPRADDIAHWAVEGIAAGCWRIPRAPPAGAAPARPSAPPVRGESGVLRLWE